MCISSRIMDIWVHALAYWCFVTRIGTPLPTPPPPEPGRQSLRCRKRVKGYKRHVQPQTNPEEEHEGYCCRHIPPYPRRQRVIVLEENLQMAVRDS